VAGTVELRVEPASSKFDANDERWQDEVAQFVLDLDSTVGEVRRETTRSEGTKGVVESIVLPLASAGTLTAAVEFFKAWLARDNGRGLKLSIGSDGATVFETSGNDIDETTRRRILEAVLARLDQSSDSA
jgi:hypothetical protein